MNHLNVAICEDNPGDAKRLLHLVNDAPFETAAVTFVNADDFAAAYVPGLFDLVLMDIYLSENPQEKEPRDIAAIAALRRIDPQVPVAFTTSSADHTLESYRVQANQYLLKPISASDVHAVLEMARVLKQARAV